jgi:hypothetical protein
MKIYKFQNLTTKELTPPIKAKNFGEVNEPIGFKIFSVEKWKDVKQALKETACLALSLGGILYLLAIQIY